MLNLRQIWRYIWKKTASQRGWSKNLPHSFCWPKLAIMTTVTRSARAQVTLGLSDSTNCGWAQHSGCTVGRCWSSTRMMFQLTSVHTKGLTLIKAFNRTGYYTASSIAHLIADSGNLYTSLIFVKSLTHLSQSSQGFLFSEVQAVCIVIILFLCVLLCILNSNKWSAVERNFLLLTQ